MLTNSPGAVVTVSGENAAVTTAAGAATAAGHDISLDADGDHGGARRERGGHRRAFAIGFAALSGAGAVTLLVLGLLGTLEWEIAGGFAGIAALGAGAVAVWLAP